MKELNKQTLDKAIQQLPGHKAPEKVWKELESKISPKFSLKLLFRNSYTTRVAAAVIFLMLLSGLYIIYISTRSEKPYRIEAEQSVEKNIELEPVQEIYIDDTVSIPDSNHIKP